MKLISGRTNLLLLLGVVVLIVAPLALVHGKFQGSDDQGSAAIAASAPGFKPWAHPLWTPPSPEIESLLFALQAALGAGVIGYVLGRIHGAGLAKTPPKPTTAAQADPAKKTAKARGSD